MARLDYRLIPHLGLYGKFTYDVNRTDTNADLCVLPGTEMTAYGGGVEFFPTKGKPVLLISTALFRTPGFEMTAFCIAREVAAEALSVTAAQARIE